MQLMLFAVIFALYPILIRKVDMLKKLLLFVCLLIPVNTALANGHLMLIGGHLDLDNKIIWEKIRELGVNSSELDTPLACIWVTNTGTPDESVKFYSDIFEKYHIASTVVPIYFDPKVKPSWQGNQNSEDIAILIKQCDIYFFTGGDQSRTTNVLFNKDGSETLALQTLRQELNNNKLLAGTSAGDMMQSDPMITGGNYNKLTNEDTVSLGKGLGFLEPNEIIVDSHFSQRNRLPRLIRAMEKSKINTGIGVDEETALLVEIDKNGKLISDWYAIGANQVIIVKFLTKDDNKEVEIITLRNMATPTI